MPIKVKEIPNDKIHIGHIKMNRNHQIPNNEGMPIDRYNFALLISAPSGAGKTNLWVSLLQRGNMLAKKFHEIHIWSPSLHTIEKDLGIPDEFIHQEMDMEELSGMLEYYKRLKESGSNKQILFIIDDMIGDLADKYGKEMMKMILNRAHMGLSIIFTSQSYTKGIPLILRKNMSGVIQFNTINKKELEAIRDELTSFSKEEWNKIIRETLISPHDFLFIKNNGEIYRNFNKLAIEFPED